MFLGMGRYHQDLKIAAPYWPYCLCTFRAVQQLLSEVYISCGGGGSQCNVLFIQRSPNFPKADRVKSHRLPCFSLIRTVARPVYTVHTEYTG